MTTWRKRAILIALAMALTAGCSGDGNDAGNGGDAGNEADDAGNGSDADDILSEPDEPDEPGVPTEAEVVLTFAPDADVPDEELAAAVAVVEQRIAALDVDGASVAVDDGTIVVGLPDEAPTDEVEAAVEARGDVRFRPVLQEEDPTGADPVTQAAEDTADQPVSLEGLDGTVYRLGPAGATGDIVESAEASIADGEWQVLLTLRSGADGIDRFNDLATLCYATDPACPLGRLAITLDSVVQSAPAIQQPTFERDQITIVGQFDDEQAKELAAVLVAGALPFGLVREG